MRVLVLGPNHPGGSLPPYLDVLTDALRRAGATVDRHGSTTIPYDSDRGAFWLLDHALDYARALLDQIDLSDYDVLSVHFGNLEVDQLLPALWAGRPRPPAVYHVHTLDPTLLRDHIADPGWHRAVRHTLRHGFDGYVYFGNYARRAWAHQVGPAAPAQVAWLPTTIPPHVRPPLPDPSPVPIISLYGFAAPWKSAGLLRAAAARMRIPARIVLAGDFWDDPTQAGVDLRAAPDPDGAGRLVLEPGYLGPVERSVLVRTSAVGVFPYQPHPAFQGSGAIADYLAHGIPVVATDVANMAELIGPAGHVVAPNDPAALAAALDNAAADTHAAAAMRHAAHARAGRFTADTHAARCLALYQHVIDHTRLEPSHPLGHLW